MFENVNMGGKLAAIESLGTYVRSLKRLDMTLGDFAKQLPPAI